MYIDRLDQPCRSLQHSTQYASIVLCNKSPAAKVHSISYTPGPGMVIFTNDKLSKNQCRHNTGPFTMGTCQPHWVTSNRLCTSSFCRLRAHAFLLPGAVPATPIFSIIIHRVPFPAAVLTLPPAWHLIQCNHGLHACKCLCSKDISSASSSHTPTTAKLWGFDSVHQLPTKRAKG